MELQQVMAEFLMYCKAEKCAAPLTLEAYASDLKGFMRTWERLGLPVQIAQCTTPTVRKCLFAMQEGRSRKASTVNRRWDTLRSLFRFAQEQGYLDKNPMDRIRSPRADKTVPVFLRLDELKRLLSIPEQKHWKHWQRDKAILYLLAYTGPFAPRLRETADRRNWACSVVRWWWWGARMGWS